MRLRLPENGSTGHGTGERFAPSEAQALPDVMVEHYHRYAMAAEHCQGKCVLDIASGDGYGSFILSQVATSVLGVDKDSEAVAGARARYVVPNLAYEQGQCTAIPAPDRSFDVVVSFETVEHIIEQREFLAEIRRVLRPNGLLVMSSPESERYADPHHNKFHVKELSGTEFRQLVSSCFANIAMMAQSSFFASAMVTENGNGHSMRFVSMPDERSLLADRRSFLPYYWIVFASDGPLPAVQDGLMQPPMVRSQLLQAVRNLGAPKALAASQSENQKLVRENGSLTQTNQKLDREKNAMQQELTLLRQKLDQEKNARQQELTLLHQKLDQEKNALQQEISRLRQGTERLTHEAEQLRQETKRLAKEKSEFAATHRQLTQINMQLTQRNQQITQDHLRGSKDLLKLQGELTTKGTALTALREEVRFLRAANNRVADIKRYAQSEVAHLELHLDELHAGLKGLWRTLQSPMRAFWTVGLVLSVMRSPRTGFWLMRDMRVIRRSGLFDAAFYLRANPEVALLSRDPLRHFCACGWRENRDPSPEFSISSYLQANRDVSSTGINPLVHYILYGQKENRPGLPKPKPVATALDPELMQEMQMILQSGLFDEAFYAQSNPDVANSACDLLWHFCTIGWKERRDPSADFSLTWYLSQYADVRCSDINPLVHYLRWGRSENRDCTDPRRAAQRVMSDSDNVVMANAEYVLRRTAVARKCRPQLTESDIAAVGKQVHTMLYPRLAEAEVARS